MANTTGKNSGPDVQLVSVYLPREVFEQLLQRAEKERRKLSPMAAILIEDALKGIAPEQTA